MELKLRLTRLSGDLLPINYQYALSSWIYRVIQRADSEYSTFLHEKGFVADGRSFKLFTFSQLDVRPYEPAGEYLRLLGRELTLTIRFHVDASLTHFITGLFQNQRFSLGDRSAQIELEVTSIETQNPPVFMQTHQYQCLSPVCVSRARGDGTAEYLSPDAHGYGDLLIKNLVRKKKALALVDDTEDSSFKFRLLNAPRKKGIHIKANTSEHTQVVGYLFHFELTAPAELHEIGYFAGFGEKNSMGFGCGKILE